MVTELLLIFIALVALRNYSRKRDRTFPPGPMGLPILGHFPLMGKFQHITLCQWKKTYGPIIGIRFGSYKVVALNETKLIREALNMNAFAGRPRLNFYEARCDGRIRGIAFTDGRHWNEQRRFALKHLRDFGFGTKTMESRIQDAVYEWLEGLKETEGKPIQVKSLFNAAIINTLWSIIFGNPIKQSDPEVQEALDSLNAFTDDASLLTALAIFIPWIAKIAPKLSGFDKMIGYLPPVKRFLRKQIANHNTLYVENQPRDFLDAYMDEVKKTTDPESSFHANQGVLVETLFDLYIGGAETASTTLSWLVAYLIHNTHVQEKLQREIDHVVGKQRKPSLADRYSMPYTDAVIHEVLRCSCLLPFAVFHATTEDVNFHGFFIPKDTMVLPNLYSAHFDESVWGDPQNFRPERFIDESGLFQKNDNLMAFSTGKRVCPGVSLARDELFLFTTNMFQMFSASASGKLPDLEPHVGFTLSPKPFKIVLKKRNEEHDS